MSNGNLWKITQDFKGNLLSEQPQVPSYIKMVAVQSYKHILFSIAVKNKLSKPTQIVFSKYFSIKCFLDTQQDSGVAKNCDKLLYNT